MYVQSIGMSPPYVVSISKVIIEIRSITFASVIWGGNLSKHSRLISSLQLKIYHLKLRVIKASMVFKLNTNADVNRELCLTIQRVFNQKLRQNSFRNCFLNSCGFLFLYFAALVKTRASDFTNIYRHKHRTNDSKKIVVLHFTLIYFLWAFLSTSHTLSQLLAIFHCPKLPDLSTCNRLSTL